jgi:hypothetical protein
MREFPPEAGGKRHEAGSSEISVKKLTGDRVPLAAPSLNHLKRVIGFRLRRSFDEQMAGYSTLAGA